jgi:hypothetical protein
MTIARRCRRLAISGFFRRKRAACVGLAVSHLSRNGRGEDAPSAFPFLPKLSGMDREAVRSIGVEAHVETLTADFGAIPGEIFASQSI